MLAHPIVISASMIAATPVAFPPTFPEIVVSKAEAKSEWPFAVDRGELSCVNFGQGSFVFFAEILPEEERGAYGEIRLPRTVVVTTNPMALFASFEDRALYAPFDSLETLIKRLAPYETMGRELCVQQKKI